jgi:hypothetical protein
VGHVTCGTGGQSSRRHRTKYVLKPAQASAGSYSNSDSRDDDGLSLVFAGMGLGGRRGGGQAASRYRAETQLLRGDARGLSRVAEGLERSAQLAASSASRLDTLKLQCKLGGWVAAGSDAREGHVAP